MDPPHIDCLLVVRYNIYKQRGYRRIAPFSVIFHSQVMPRRSIVSHNIRVAAFAALLLPVFAFASVAGIPQGSGNSREHPNRAEFMRQRLGAAASELREGPNRVGAGAHIQNEILVKFKNEGRARRLVLPTGMTVENALTRYGNRSDVEFAEPNYIAEAFTVPNDPFYVYQWHFDNPVYGGVHAESAWNTTTGTGVVVAVIDTGVAYEDYTQGSTRYYRAPDLQNTAFASGYDFVNNDTHPNDDEGHGTHVAGTIAQSTNNGSGVAGLSYGAKIMPVKVLNRFGSGTYAAIADGIYYAADHGAQVINLSLGGSSSSQTLEDALAYAYGKGVTIVAAAGNNGSSVISYPAAYNNYVIAVGATRFDEARSSYSNYGAGLDVVAPGGDLNVDQNADGYGDGVLQQTFGPRYNDWGYYFYQGTSMASPHVAAVAALVIAYGNATTPTAVRAAIETTADDLGSDGWDQTYGWGLLNAAAALGYAAGPVDNSPSVTVTNPAANNTVTGVVTISANASDDHGVDRVEFTVDNALIGSDTTAPYEAAWDSATVPDGTHLIKALAYDSSGQSSSSTISVKTENVNNSPVANAGSDQSATDNNGNNSEVVTLNGTASSDPEGVIVSYEWREAGVLIGTGVTTSIAFAIGTHAVTLTVTDDGGLSTEDTVVITVAAQPSEIVAFEDGFESSLGNWTQDAQNDWQRSTSRAFAGSAAAEVDGLANNSELRSPQVNLQGRTNAIITFAWYIESGLDSGEYLAFDVSTNGGVSWTEYARLRGNVDPEDVWHTVTTGLTGINQLKFRYRGTMSSSSEDAYVDKVRVTAS